MNIFEEGCGRADREYRLDWCTLHARSIWECWTVARVESEELRSKLDLATKCNCPSPCNAQGCILKSNWRLKEENKTLSLAIKDANLQIESLKRDLNLSKEIARRLTKGETTVQDAAFWEKQSHFSMDRANKLEDWLRTQSYATWERALKEGVISIAIAGAEKRFCEERVPGPGWEGVRPICGLPLPCKNHGGKS